jgi:hypothetical protein
MESCLDEYNMPKKQNVNNKNENLPRDSNWETPLPKKPNGLIILESSKNAFRKPFGHFPTLFWFSNHNTRHKEHE